jgi:DNA helicase-2/ATP-dependent DNA helicase PcrA
MRLTVKEIDQMKSGSDYEIAPIYHEYCRVMRETKRMDYDDQMVYAYSILKRHPDILDYFQRKYRYLCVDEAQDTSKIQHLLIRQLSGSQPNLFMVGDEDQSIYGFRAAYPQALMEFSHVYPEASVLLMETNYRSTPQIVQAADRFILQNKNRYPKNMKASGKRTACEADSGL